MIRRIRDYSKREPSRDAHKIYIICEGKGTEPNYFAFFEGMSSNLEVITIPPTEGTDPLKLLERAKQVLLGEERKYTLDFLHRDTVWFVIDTDTWEKEGKITPLREFCAQLNVAIPQKYDEAKSYSAWNVAQSNPSFEIWLYYHFYDAMPTTDEVEKHASFKEYVDATYQYQTIIKTLLYNTTLNVANETQITYERPDDYYNYLQTMQPFENVAFFYTQSTLAAMQTSNLVKNFSSQTDLRYHPSTRQLQAANKYLQSIAEFNELSADDIAAVRQDCPGLSEAILQQNDLLLQRIEEVKKSTGYKVVNIDEDLKGADIFKALIAPYKGKPLLVDFWATWCGPCKAAMQTILPVKEALAGKVNFIYVTGPSSPKKTWEMTIPDIHGDHYYVTESQYSELLKQFESNGIPTYVIVDREGNVKNKYIGYPGNEVMEEQLR